MSKRPAPVNLQEKIAEARKRAEEVRARLEREQAAKVPAPNGLQNGASSAASAADKLAAMKARIAAATANLKQTQTTTSTLSTFTPPSSTPTPPPPPPSRSAFTAPPRESFQRAERNDSSRMDMGPAPRGGLSMMIHPSLLGDSQEKKETKGLKGKDSSQQAKSQENLNPYLSEEKGPSGRARRTLAFTHNLHSRPAMVAANETRRKAVLEAMKKKIELSSVKVGIDDATETQSYLVAMPPDVEFWDEGLQSGIENNELIGPYVVHPIMIQPPQDKLFTKPLQLYLTKTEAKKARRIKRMEIHKEEQVCFLRMRVYCEAMC
jgi:U4/U6 small nuclear ribonucleoprotein PRP3